jgi:hypothetical protein
LSDFKQNTEMLEELNVAPIQDKISNYKQTRQVMWTGCLYQGYQNW